MKEEDNIENFFKDNDIQHFDIKPEWLEDMSSKLDAYNATKKGFNYYWLLLLVLPLALVIAIFFPSSIPSTTQSADESVIVENKTVIGNKGTEKATPFTHKNKINNAENQKLSESKNDFLPKEKVGGHPSSNDETIAKDRVNQSKTYKLANRLQIDQTPAKAQANARNKNNFVNSDDTPGYTDSNTQKNNVSQSNISHANVNSSLNQSVNSDKLSTSSENVEGNNAMESPDLNASSNLNNHFDTKTKADTQSGSNIAATPPKQIEVESTENPQQADKQNELSIDSAKISENEDILEGTTSEKELEEEIKITKKKTDFKVWSAGFTFGPDLLQRQLTSSATLLNFEQKKAEEQIKNTWGFDFELNRYLTPWLAVGSGIGYKSYKEAINYNAITSTFIDTTYTSKNNTYVIFTDSMFVIVQDSSGNDLDTTWYYTDSTIVTETVTDTNIVSSTEVDSSKKAANGVVTSSYVQIPINAQFIFINSKKLTAYTNLGLSIGLLTKNTGVIIDYETNNIVNYTTRKMIYNGNIGLGFNYNFYGPLDYKFYGAYQFSLSNFSLRPDVDKRYNGLAIRTGLVFHF